MVTCLIMSFVQEAMRRCLLVGALLPRPASPMRRHVTGTTTADPPETTATSSTVRVH